MRLAPLLSRGTQGGRAGASIYSCRKPFPGQFVVREATAHGWAQGGYEPASIAVLAGVEAECFFVQIAEQVERFDAHVGARVTA